MIHYRILAHLVGYVKFKFKKTNDMKHLFVYLLFVLNTQIAFGQYLYRYESQITELKEIKVENQFSKSLSDSKESAYYSKAYLTNQGDTVTIMPKIAIIVKSDVQPNSVIKQFGDKLSFRKKLGSRVLVYDCNVQNSDEVLGITTILSNSEDIIGCEAFVNNKIILLNTHYSKQYYLHDTSSSSVGIHMGSVWEITSGYGEGITVAVLDSGVEHNHEDLPNVLDGYTVENPSGKGDPINTVNDDNGHGTACAGIIGAANNSLGIRGIVSNAKILPVNISNYYGIADSEKVAEAILWASERADVLSCSWSLFKESMSVIEAIQDAKTKGRNGKGCVVVFAAGNSGQNKLAFPASVEGVISVGAVDKTGKIWDYSQRGKGLSLVAPSGNVNLQGDIVTTDRMGSFGYDTGNYTEKFGGTSAACPQVAGVAALLLSIRPDLTAAEVKEVLQRTATDLGTTGYDTTYGYGLLNAYEAVKDVRTISGPREAKSKGSFTVGKFLKNVSITWNVEEKDKDKVKLTVSGDFGEDCIAALVGTKTVNTKLSAVVKHSDITVATLTKNITLIGTLYGTYSVTATTVNGVSLPAIVNRPFNNGSTLEGHAGSTITINSDDFRYYSASWAGSTIQGWTKGLDFVRFSYPMTASGSTRLEFTGKIAGTARLQVYVVGPHYSVNISQEGEILGISIIKEEQEDIEEYDAEEISRMSATETSGNIWTIEVMNVTTGMRQGQLETSTGECEFNTSGWQPGIYLIRASNGENTISKKIAIK